MTMTSAITGMAGSTADMIFVIAGGRFGEEYINPMPDSMHRLPRINLTSGIHRDTYPYDKNARNIRNTASIIRIAPIDINNAPPNTVGC